MAKMSLDEVRDGLLKLKSAGVSSEKIAQYVSASGFTRDEILSGGVGQPKEPEPLSATESLRLGLPTTGARREEVARKMFGEGNVRFPGRSSIPPPSTYDPIMGGANVSGMRPEDAMRSAIGPMLSGAGPSFRRAPEESFRPLRPEGLAPNIAYYLPDIVEIGAMMTPAGRGVVGPAMKIAGREQIARGLRHLGDIASGGVGSQGPVERIEDVAQAGLGAGIGEFGGRAVGAGLSKLGAKMTAPTGRTMKMKVIEAEGGIPLTPGELTGNSTLSSVEDFLRNYFSTRSKWTTFDVGRYKAATNRIEGAVSRLRRSQNPIEREAVGRRLSDSFREAVRLTFKRADDEAAQNFGAVHAMAGGQPIVNANALRDEYLDIYATARSATNKTATEAASEKMAKKHLSGYGVRFLKNGDVDPGSLAGPMMITADELQRGLTRFGELSRGKGRLFEGLERDESRMFSARLYKAAVETLDSGVPGDIAEPWAEARRLYKARMDEARSLQSSILGSWIPKTEGKAFMAPEDIAAKLTTMEPSEAKSLIHVLRHASDLGVPGASELRGDTAAFLIQDALNQSTGKVGKRVPRIMTEAGEGIRFNPRTFVDKSNLRLIGELAQSDAEKREIVGIYRNLEAIVDSPVRPGSQTAPRQFVWDAGKKAFAVLIAPAVALGLGAKGYKEEGKPGAVAGAAGGLAAMYFGPRVLSKALLDPQGRRYLRMLMSGVAVPAKKSATIAGYFAALKASTPDDETVTPLPTEEPASPGPPPGTP